MIEDFPTIDGGRYRIEGMLGEGGMAAVFRAFDTKLQVERAIKVLSPDFTTRASIRTRFEAEASTMAQLHHPHIVTVYDYGCTEGRLFIVMEMLMGGSLESRVLKHGLLHPQQAIDVAIAMCRGLGQAHKARVIHRDVKPDNVLLSRDGIPKITDFGIARIEDKDSGHTRTSAVMGTLKYMAPEQRLSAKKVLPQSDLYAVGASIWYCIKGGDPSLIYDQDHQDEMFEGLEPAVVAFLQKACNFNPKSRPANADEMIAELETLKSEIAALPPTAFPLVVEDAGPHKYAPPSGENLPKLHTVWETYGTEAGPTKANTSANDTVNFDMFEEFPDEEEAGTLLPESTEEVPKEETISVAESPPPAAPSPPSHPGSAPKKSMVLPIVIGVGVCILLAVGMLSGKGSEETQAPSQPAPEPQTQEAAVAPGEAEQIQRDAAKKEEAPAVETVAEKPPPTPPKKPAPSSSKPAPSMGTLNISSVPFPVRISLDGKKRKLNRKQYKDQVPAGKHKVQIEIRNGSIHEATITVLKDKENNYCWNFAKKAACSK
jgi:eukaryotic-like serine/threonine-protein kinase